MVGQILDQAKKTLEDRGNIYGEPENSFSRIAAYWNTYLDNREDKQKPLSESDIALMMILLKISREQFQVNRDNWVDIAGYADVGYHATIADVIDKSLERIIASSGASHCNFSKTPLGEPLHKETTPITLCREAVDGLPKNNVKENSNE